jgi:hypothetical protein
MKSQPLLNRVRKAAATPTSAERIAMAQGHAAEQQAKVAPVRVFFALSALRSRSDYVSSGETTQATKTALMLQRDPDSVSHP